MFPNKVLDSIVSIVAYHQNKPKVTLSFEINRDTNM